MHTRTPDRSPRRRLARWAAVLTLGPLLGGCTGPREYFQNCFKVGPNYKRPPAAVADNWIDYADPRVQSVAVDDSHWWTVFNDPVLAALVQKAYQQNLTLREAGFRVLQARALRGVAVSTLFPQQQQAYADYNRNALSLNAANQESLPDRWYDNWDAGFTLAWELDFWGRFRRLVEVYSAELDASVEGYDAVLVTLIGDVAQTYVQIRTLEARIRFTQENVKLQQGTLEIAEIRFKEGATTDLDVQQAKTNLAQTEALIPPLEIALRQAQNRLCVLLGVPPHNLWPEIGRGPIPATPVEVAVGIPADLLRRRPDVREAERQLAAQSARIGVAMSDFYPQISLVGTLGVQAKNLSDLFENQSFVGQVGPSFRWNILLYGKLLNDVRFQEARFQELAAAYQHAVLKADQEVENGLVAFLQSQQQVKYLTESTAAAKKAADLALIQYREGKVDFNRVYLLEGVLVQQQDQLAQARGNVALGLIEVYRALGGGWQIRCEPPQPVELVPTAGAETGPVVPADKVLPPAQPDAVPPQAGEAVSERKAAS